MIVDAQVHLWGADTPERPWPPGGTHTAHRAVPVDEDELLRAMDGAGVDRAVIVPPSWEGDRNDLALAAAARHPGRFAVMGRFPAHTRDEDAERAVKRWRDRPGMLGVRLVLHRDPWRRWFLQGRFDWFWAAAERAGLPVMVYAPGVLGPVAAVARRHPGLRLILDHLALEVTARDDEAFAALDGPNGLLALAVHPNVAVKASALPCHTADPYPFPALHAPLRRVHAAFGAGRVFWGSDYSRLPCPYEECLRLFTHALDFLSEEERRLMTGEGLRRWLDWP